jgi:hypothetical protein
VDGMTDEQDRRLAVLIDADNAQAAIINKRSPQFDQRNAGYAKLSDLMGAISLFEVQGRLLGKGPGKRFYVRDRRKNGQG